MLIGLTGGIASGKSTVSSIIKSKGIPIIDADQIAREVVEPGSKTLQEIVKHFGQGILNEDGTLARKKLGAIIFNQPKERQTLNQMIHPAVRQRMQEQKEKFMEAGEKTIVFDIPLLYESDLFHLVEKVLLVYVDETTQLRRLMQRDQAGEDDAKSRMASQMPLVQKRERADAIIDNSGTIEETIKQLENILEKWSDD
ncbi:dephospho-CoA kinase [Halalkalibacter wakoensis JCM 9140]|uniref:Dephospho-CoA kinase n=1 Tax=Halalkalibacter wakoensis JCM 9140 TaxID=1236970 RepID=W4Q8D1_9BACI|nr:dephospho-CoA kinase [Halalkalibacter wakoensis]GAE27913.1 dephospho-CoA kinase [Halalkalibacter wakoensis JCM 9140]